MKSKKTGLTYPEPTIPPQAELYQCFSTASVGDIVILYIKYKNNISSIYQCFVTHVSQKHIFVTHVSHGFSIQDGKANDKHGTLIEHWQLLPYTEELQLAAKHSLLVDKVSSILYSMAYLLEVMSEEQLTAIELIFDQAKNQYPVYPLMNAKDDQMLEIERQKICTRVHDKTGEIQ